MPRYTYQFVDTEESQKQLHQAIEELNDLEINFELQSLFSLMGIDLVDFKLEYGYDVHGDLFLADELSPDNMRLWKRGTKERFDKDLFRKDEGDIVEAYKYILQKLKEFA